MHDSALLRGLFAQDRTINTVSVRTRERLKVLLRADVRPHSAGVKRRRQKAQREAAARLRARRLVAGSGVSPMRQTGTVPLSACVGRARGTVGTSSAVQSPFGDLATAGGGRWFRGRMRSGGCRRNRPRPVPLAGQVIPARPKAEAVGTPRREFSLAAGLAARFGGHSADGSGQRQQRGRGEVRLGRGNGRLRPCRSAM